MEQQNYMVWVRCFTYNHAPYIEDALNGFCMQETTFPFVCTIVDDASTDGEQEVIKNYLQEHFDLEDKAIVRNEETDDYILTFARHKTNINCFFAVLYLKYNHYSVKKPKMPYIQEWNDNARYIALCEGDDFWIGKEFLQQSVSFLDKNPKYSCVFGNRIVCNEDATQFRTFKFKGDLTINDIMHGTNMGLRNLCFRSEVLKAASSVVGARDLYLYYRCAVSGKMKYMDKDFAVYRYTGKGVCSSITGREAIFTRYQHYYNFHKATNFKYQKEYVNYQIRQMFSNLFYPSLLMYCLQMTQRFHVPSRWRYAWYIWFVISNICGKLYTLVIKLF